jgi:signal transduction histidine kinase
MEYERSLFEQQVSKLVQEQLSEWDASMARTARNMARSVEGTAWDVGDHDALRRQIQKDGRIRQFFVVGSNGQFVYPPVQNTMSQGERDFIERTRTVWESGAIAPLRPNEKIAPGGFRNVARFTKAAQSAKGQWHPWYWGNGLQLIYWWPTDSGEIHGVEWDRIRLVSDLSGALPDTALEAAEETLGVQWIGATGQVLYQWGVVPADESGTLVTAHAMADPFGAWSFKAYMNIGAPAKSVRMWYLGAGLSAVMLLFISLGAYFYRENTRELREAAQRISFVNHVSHELKTPLTNIRLYAELLRDDADETAGRGKKRLSVILSESERLSRLINNVLAFSRTRASTLKLNPTVGSVDERLQHVANEFRPLLAQQGIDLCYEGINDGKVCFDSDVLEQIVGNLLSNVEKYARSASKVTLESRVNSDEIEVTVHDNGGGIPKRDRDAIFDPYYRVSSASNEGVAGTGIGLSIARELAQIHGGSLILEPSKAGARFCIRLQIQPGGIQ